MQVLESGAVPAAHPDASVAKVLKAVSAESLREAVGSHSLRPPASYLGKRPRRCLGRGPGDGMEQAVAPAPVS